MKNIKKLYITVTLLSFLSLSCLGKPDEIRTFNSNIITVPGTTRTLDLNDRESFKQKSYSALSESGDGVDIVDVETKIVECGEGPRCIHHYYEGGALGRWMKERLCVDPTNREIFFQSSLKAFHVKKSDDQYVVSPTETCHFFPRLDIFLKAQEFYERGMGFLEEKNYISAQRHFRLISAQTENSNVRFRGDLMLGNMLHKGNLGDGPDEKAGQVYWERVATQDIVPEVAADAAYNLARWQYNKEGAHEERGPSAKRWFERVIACNDVERTPQASYWLGCLYANIDIQGGEPCYPTARKYLEVAKKKCKELDLRIKANFYIGKTYYLEGEFAQSEAYFENAAAQTANMEIQAKANYHLALVYQSGLSGEKPNYELMYQRFKKAIARLEEEDIEANIRYRLLLGGMILHYMAKDSEKLREAQECFEWGAEQEVSPEMRAKSELHLGFMYQRGKIGGEPDFERSKEHYEKAIEHGKSSWVWYEATHNLGCVYLYGELGGESYFGKAKECFDEVAGGSNPRLCAAANLELATMHLGGCFEGEIDFERAKECLLKALGAGASENTIQKAWILLGELYYSGDLSDGQDLRQAREYLELASHEASDWNADQYLALMYYKGEIGDGPDYEKAWKYNERVIARTKDEGFVVAATLNFAELSYKGQVGDGPDFEKARSYLRIATKKAVSPDSKQRVEAFLKELEKAEKS